MSAPLSRRGALRAITSTALATTIAAPAALAVLIDQQPDPVYAAIEAHTAAWQAVGPAMDASDDAEEQFGRGSTEHQTAMACQMAATDREMSLLDALTEVQPTTPAGFQAWCAYLVGERGFRGIAIPHEQALAILTTAGEAVARMSQPAEVDHER